MTRLPHLTVCVLAAASLAACAVGPNYKTPTAPSQTAFKEADGWTPAQPLDALDRGAWWTAYGDATLDALEARVSVSNQSLIAQEAAYRQSLSALAETDATLFPSLSASLSSNKSGGKGLAATSSNGSTAATRNTGSVSAAWSFDLWGKVRRQIEAARANAQLSAADLANVRLSLQSTLAQDYVQLRALDALHQLLTQTVANDSRALTLTENQYKVGVAAKADVITARTQLDTARANLADLTQQRQALEHAIAVLVGETPGAFTLPPGDLPQAAPAAPLNLAATLLQRRPDVAASERAVQAASAGIGVAQAAYFPSLTLSASDTSTASKLSNLFRASTTSWTYGASAAETLFDFGGREAQVSGAKQLYRQRVAEYRQTVLGALQGVEDQIVALRTLETELSLRLTAEADARQAEAIALNQYKAGTISYSGVILAQNTALAAEESTLSTRRDRLLASIRLIAALGGGWTRADLPREGPLAGVF